MSFLHEKNLFLILDFDSTFVQVETLDMLAEICLNKSKNKTVLMQEISNLTKLGMEGKLSFSESLEQRLKLFKPKIKDIDEVVKKLQKTITRSIKKNQSFIETNANRIYIISGGFEEFINPVVQNFGISRRHVVANRFLYKHGEIVDYDRTRQTACGGGKAIAACTLKLDGKIIVIGDGITDFEIAEKLDNANFIAFAENVTRENVWSKAKFAANDFREIIRYLDS